MCKRLVSIGCVAAIGYYLWSVFAAVQTRETLTSLLNDVRHLDIAIEQYASDHRLGPEDQVDWSMAVRYLNTNSRLLKGGGKDLLGNPYVIGPTRKDGVKVSEETKNSFRPEMVPAGFWSEY